MPDPNHPSLRRAPDSSQPYREPSTARDEAPAHAAEFKPYKVVGKSEWDGGYEVCLGGSPYSTVRVSVSSATFRETSVGDLVFVRLEKVTPGPERGSRP
jgi:hypothetical protein